MSVVVMGMEMPRNCESCCLVENTISGISKCRETRRIWDPDPGQPLRPDWCPLRPLPEKHGRLVDADKLEAEGYALSKLHIDNSTGNVWRDAIPFDEAPTVIEAEGDEMTELKPCPFCGSDKLWVNEIAGVYVCVSCAHCDCEGPVGVNQKEAYALWNRRAGDDGSGRNIR